MPYNSVAAHVDSVITEHAMAICVKFEGSDPCRKQKPDDS